MSTRMDDHEMVRRIEAILASRPTDHMLGCRVRLLFETRGTRRTVIELPDERPYDPRD